MRIQLRMQINERKAVCEVSRITLNYAAAQLVNIDSICENILGADAGVSSPLATIRISNVR